MQAVQLVWHTVGELLSDNFTLEGACSLIPHDIIMGVMAACVRLPLSSFATPKTRFGVRRHLRPTASHCRAQMPVAAYLAQASWYWVGGLKGLQLPLACRQDRKHAADAGPLAAGSHALVHCTCAMYDEGTVGIVTGTQSGVAHALNLHNPDVCMRIVHAEIRAADRA